MHVRWCLAESETYEGMKTMSIAAEIKCVTDLLFVSNLSPRFKWLGSGILVVFFEKSKVRITRRVNADANKKIFCLALQSLQVTKQTL